MPSRDRPANYRQAPDKAGQFADPDTITLEDYRRAHGRCLECGQPLKTGQLRNGGRYCSHRCAGLHTARREYGPDVVPYQPGTTAEEKEGGPVGIVHDLIGDQYDTTTGEHNGYPLPDRCEQCRGPYRRKRKDQRFCSPDCANRWRNQNRPDRGQPPARPGPAAPPAMVTSMSAGPGVDLAGLLAQILGGADQWHLTARIGDVALTLTRPAP